jgi:hypothetical protein
MHCIFKSKTLIVLEIKMQKLEYQMHLQVTDHVKKIFYAYKKYIKFYIFTIRSAFIILFIVNWVKWNYFTFYNVELSWFII